MDLVTMKRRKSGGMAARLIGSETYSPGARRWDRNRFDGTFKAALVEANANAMLFNHHFVDVHHILLALVGQPGGIARQTMQERGVEYKHVYSKLAILDPMRPRRVVNHKLPLTPDARKAILMALEEAQLVKRKIIDSNLLFMGVLRVNTGIARTVLESFGVDCRTTYNLIHENGVKKSSDLPTTFI